MKPIRVVQYGTWEYTHAEHTMLAMRSLPEYFDIAGLCEPNPEHLKKALKKSAYQNLRIYSLSNSFQINL